MKKYMTDKDRAEEAEVLRIALAIVHIAVLDLDSKLPVLPPRFAQFLIAPEAHLLIVPATSVNDNDRRKVEDAMRMSCSDAIIVSVSRPSIGPKKIMIEVGIDRRTPVWHSEYCPRVVDGSLYFAPGYDPSGPLFKLTKKGLMSSADFDGMRLDGY